MLIRAAELDGAGPIDVRLDGAHVAEIGSGMRPRGDEPVRDARGGALLPGLHDHHIHLHALAASGASVPCGPPAVRDGAALARVLRAAAGAGSGWLRGVAYHESVAGTLCREQLDRWVADRPLRIQHRSGAAWMLNSAALEALGLEGAIRGEGPPPDAVERGADGRPTGRLFRADAWLRERTRARAPDLAPVGALLASFGVTGATDASAHNDADLLERLCRASERGALPQRLLVMGAPGLPPSRAPRVERGAVKILLDEPRLPDFDVLCARIRAAHGEGRAVAIHCVTRAEAFFAVEALRTAGPRAGDRLEHAAVAPPELVAAVASLPLTIVTQPHFVRERGDAYREDVAAEDLPWLYRLRAWREAGVPLAAGSDAPFGSPDPWRSMAAAVARSSASGAPLGRDEALPPEQALALYLTSAASPGGALRRVAVGAPADLCLLDRPWREAREQLTSGTVAATWCDGRLVFERDRGDLRLGHDVAG